MTTVMTYSSLVNDIEIYLDRNDTVLISMIPEFITLAELRCAREVKNLGMKQSCVSTFNPNLSVYLKPKNWLETISINFGSEPAFNTTFRQAASGTVTLTLAAAHNFAVGNQIQVFNLGNTNYNGIFVITAVTQYTISYVSGSFTESKTADTAGIVTATLNARNQILPRSLEYCNAFWPDRTQTGTPRFYADYNYNNWLIVPTPIIAFPFEVVFWGQPQFLSTTNTTNWWTAYARDLLLYACLLETAPYLKNDQRIQTWQGRYDMAKSMITGQNLDRVNDGSMVRMDVGMSQNMSPGGAR